MLDYGKLVAGEKLVPVTFRIPESWRDQVRELAADPNFYAEDTSHLYRTALGNYLASLAKMQVGDEAMQGYWSAAALRSEAIASVMEYEMARWFGLLEAPLLEAVRDEAFSATVGALEKIRDAVDAVTNADAAATLRRLVAHSEPVQSAVALLGNTWMKGPRQLATWRAHTATVWEQWLFKLKEELDVQSPR